MADYRYLFANALTGSLLEELPLDCQSFSQQINGVGQLTGTLALGDIKPAVNWRAATALKRTWLIVQRGDQYVWGGTIMKRRPTNNGNSAEITAETLEGYLGRRRIKTDLTQTAADVLDIVRAIIAQMQTVTGGNIRLQVTAGTAGYIQTVTYLAKDRHKISDAINRLTEVTPGFEYAVTWARSGNIFTPTLRLASPGLSVGLNPIALEYPGNLMSYGWDEDGGNAPNALTGVGADAAGAPLMVEQVDTSGEIAAGVPIYEDELPLKEEADTNRLGTRTATALTAKLADYVVPTAELRGDADPHFGDIPLGIAARLRATSLYHPAGVNGAPGVDVTRRVTGWTVKPQAAEIVSLTLGSTTGKIALPAMRRGQDAAIADIARRLRVLETI